MLAGYHGDGRRGFAHGRLLAFTATLARPRAGRPVTRPDPPDATSPCLPSLATHSTAMHFNRHARRATFNSFRTRHSTGTSDGIGRNRITHSVTSPSHRRLDRLLVPLRQLPQVRQDLIPQPPV